MYSGARLIRFDPDYKQLSSRRQRCDVASIVAAFQNTHGMHSRIKQRLPNTTGDPFSTEANFGFDPKYNNNHLYPYDTILEDKELLRQEKKERAKTNNPMTPAMHGHVKQAVSATATPSVSALRLNPGSNSNHISGQSTIGASLPNWEALLSPEAGGDGSSRNLHAVINSQMNLNMSLTAGFPNTGGIMGLMGNLDSMVPQDVLNMHDDTKDDEDEPGQGHKSRKSTGGGSMGMTSSLITPKLNPVSQSAGGTPFGSRPASTRKWSNDLNMIFNQVSQPRMNVNKEVKKTKRPGWITLNQFVHLATNLRAGGQRDAQVLVLTHNTFCESKFSYFCLACKSSAL